MTTALPRTDVTLTTIASVPEPAAATTVPASRAGTTGPIAYLTGEYPKVSHTFILREIAALRARGVDVLPCSIRRTAPRDIVGEDAQAEAAATYCVQDDARRPLRLLAVHLALFGRSPREWLSALGLAWRTRPPGARAALWQLFYFLEAGVLAQHLLETGAKHLHNHFADSSCSVAMLTSALSGIPFSFTIHGPTEFFEPMRWALGDKVAHARFVVCISQFARSQMMLFSAQSDWGKLDIVHCGIDPARYGQRPHRPSGKRVMFVGRLAAVKGVPLLLEAVARLRAQHPELELTVVGDGPDRVALEANTAALGITARVHFLGYQSQDAVAALLNEHDLMVLPSFAEGVPIVLMEAMASRLPVVASRVAGIPELVEDGVAGFLVPPGDVDALTERLDDLLADPDLRARMGHAGRAKVEAEFSLDREAKEMASAFSFQAAAASVGAPTRHAAGISS